MRERIIADIRLFRREGRTGSGHFDMVSLDCTEGAYDDLPYRGHMCLGRNIACRDRMLEEKLIDENTVRSNCKKFITAMDKYYNGHPRRSCVCGRACTRILYEREAQNS